MSLEQEIKQTQFQSQYVKGILNVLVTADRISALSNAALKPFGVSKEQFNVLRILRGAGKTPYSLQEIQERMISRSSNATRLVEKLRAKGLVDRQTCPANRRKVDIFITQKGLDALKEMDPAMRGSSMSLGELTEEEARELNRLLDKMRG